MSKIKFILLLMITLTLSFTVFSQTEVWQQYDSSIAGFKVKYPSDWQIQEQEAKGQVWRVTFVSPGVWDDDVVESDSIIICSKPKENSFEKLDRCAEHHLLVKDTKAVSEKIVSINGLEVLKRENKKFSENDDSVFNAFFSTKDRDFQVIGDFRKVFNLERFIPVFDKMLATFQFLPPINVTTYKNNKFDFALTFPDSWKNCGLADSDLNENKLLLIVPKDKDCSGENFIAVSSVSELSGKLLSGYELQQKLKSSYFTKINPFLNGGSAQAEKSDKNYFYRESLFFTNFLATYDLIKISEQTEIGRKDFQKQAAEILTTTQRFLKQN